MKKFFLETNPYIVQQKKSYYLWYKNEVKDDSGSRDIQDLEAENEQLKAYIDYITSLRYWKFGKKVNYILKKLRGR